jgi:hypothetical protein
VITLLRTLSSLSLEEEPSDEDEEEELERSAFRLLFDLLWRSFLDFFSFLLFFSCNRTLQHLVTFPQMYIHGLERYLLVLLFRLVLLGFLFV